jgi:hypothetical protein
VRAAFVGGDRVDLVDDHRPHVTQRAPPGLRRQQDEQRLGRRDQHVRRVQRRLAPLARGRIAVRTAVRTPGAGKPSSVASARSSASGSSRLRRMSLDSAFSGDT